MATSSFGKAATSTPGGTFSNVGTTGLKQQNGYVFEEFLPQLRGSAQAARFYREMSDNNPIAAGIIMGYQQIATHLNWQINEHPNSTAKDTAAVEFIKDAFDDMDETWDSQLVNMLSCLIYGYSYHEVVYKKRPDGKIGWAGFPIRAQETLFHWNLGDHGEILSMVQIDPSNGRVYEVPYGKALLFRTTKFKNNPEGRSILRGAVVPYMFLKRIQEYEAIGVERDLAGLPIAWVPQEWFFAQDDQTKQALIDIQNTVRDVRNNERAGLVFPLSYAPGMTEGTTTHDKEFNFELLGAPGAKQFDTDKIIQRYNLQIAQSVLADFILMGHEQSGSRALGTTKMALWAMVVDAMCKSVSEEFNNRAIKTLLDLNGIKYDHAPVLSYSDLSESNSAAIGAYVAALMGAGAMTPDEDTENWLREQVDMPPLAQGTEGVYDKAPTPPVMPDGTPVPVPGQPPKPGEPVPPKPDAPAPKDAPKTPVTGTPQANPDKAAVDAQHAKDNPVPAKAK